MATLDEAQGGVEKTVSPAPLVRDLVFDLEPGGAEWTVAGPAPESPAHKAPNPLQDPELVALLVDLREAVSVAVPLDAPDAEATVAVLDGLAQRIAEKLTAVLLSDTTRREVLCRVNAVDQGRARLVIRVPDRGPVSDQALALPWELLTPAAGAFAVRDGRLDVVREAVMDGASHLPEPTGPLTVAVTIAAPADQTRLDYEKESFRLQGALTSLGQRAAFSDLGGVEDFVEVVEGQKASVVHFSGHGLPGGLVFEDEQGFSNTVRVDEVVRRLHVALPESGSFPRLFFLASCHGATETSVPVEVASALGGGPSTAATLHRSGFVQVVGYFGPVGDELCTRAEETFYRALSEGSTTLHAAAEARASLSEPLKIDGQGIVYPLGWAQLVVYHRGPDHALARPDEAGRKPLARRYRRRTVEVSGLPVLESGFVGRRSLQHEIRRKVERDGVRLIVLQGLGGLGKTALASQLLSHTFALDARDQLILRGRGLDEEAEPIATLRAQAEEHGKIHELPHWEKRLKRLREEVPEPATGFAATIEELRKDRPRLVLYVDNSESLQDGPKTDDPKALGSWKPKAQEWWGEMKRLSEKGLVLVSTRYGWKSLKPESWIAVDPMSPADVLHMLDAFPSFAPLLRKDRERLATRVDGHPRTLEVLDRLVNERLEDQGPGFEVRDAWADLIEPVLPKHLEEIHADLLLEELWDRLTPPAREHTVRLGVLRVPAPRFVIDRVGIATGELIRTGLLTRFREQMLSEEGLEWVDRWGLHSLVRSFVESKTGDAERGDAHLAAGVAYETWVKEPGTRWSDQVEGIHHLHAVGEGDRAWPMVGKYVPWLRLQARFREALLLLEICEAAGTTGEQLSHALMLQVHMRRRLGERSLELVQTLERALTLAASDQTKGNVLAEYGGLRAVRGEYSEAENLFRQSLEVTEKSLGVWHSDYGVSLHELAALLSLRRKYGEAERLLRQSLEVLKKSLGVWHHFYGASLHELAGVLFCQGKYVEAENLCRQALEVLEKSLGAWHPSLCPTLSCLAFALGRLDRAAEGEFYLSRALEVSVRALGPANPDVAEILTMLAQIQAVLGRTEASETARMALAALKATLGAEHPVTQQIAPTLQKIAAGGTTRT
jgi:tetratricopeptide (TPR) repeat protein